MGALLPWVPAFAGVRFLRATSVVPRRRPGSIVEGWACAALGPGFRRGTYSCHKGTAAGCFWAYAGFGPGVHGAVACRCAMVLNQVQHDGGSIVAYALLR
jgi:hypothetical protein